MKKIFALFLSMLLFASVYGAVPVAAAQEHILYVGDGGSADLQEAFDATAEHETTTIQLTQDLLVDTVATLPQGKSVILDLNGHSIRVNDVNFTGRPLVNWGTMVITGNGRIDASIAKQGGYGAIDNYGTITIENGHFTGAVEANGATVRNRGDAQLTIEGGTFDGGTSILYNEGIATVHDGSFIGSSCSSCNRAVLPSRSCISTMERSSAYRERSPHLQAIPRFTTDILRPLPARRMVPPVPSIRCISPGRAER